MKKNLFTSFGIGMLSLPIIMNSAAIAEGRNHSGDGIKVVNNYNYGQAPIRKERVYVAQPVPVYTQVQPAPVYTQPQPVRIEIQPVHTEVQPVYTEAQPVYVEPVVEVEEVRSAAVVKPTQSVGRDWYAAVKYVHTLATFSSKHYTNGIYNYGNTPYGKDKFDMVPMMGFSVSAGTWYDADWRMELEAGYTGKYSDSADDVQFGISAPYLSFNALYNFSGPNSSGFYAGPGLGIAFPTTEVTAGGTYVHFLHDGASKTEFSPLLALMGGYQWMLNERFAVDLGYKLYAFSGTNHSRDFQYWISGNPATTTNATFTNKTGWLINNAFSLGLRYYF